MRGQNIPKLPNSGACVKTGGTGTGALVERGWELEHCLDWWPGLEVRECGEAGKVGLGLLGRFRHQCWERDCERRLSFWQGSILNRINSD